MTNQEWLPVPGDIRIGDVMVHDDPPPTEFDDLEEGFAPRPRKRLGKLTLLLAALVLVGVGVLGGIQLNKHQGASATGAATGAGARNAALGEGFTGLGAAPYGVAGAGAGGTRNGAAGSTGATGTTASPVAVGAVVSVNATTLVLKNLGGQQVTVKLNATTTVTKVIGAADLAAGQTVSVYGVTAADGSVTATNVTVR